MSRLFNLLEIRLGFRHPKIKNGISVRLKELWFGNLLCGDG